MLHNLKIFVLIPALIIIIVLISWNYGRDYLDKSYRSTVPALYLDKVLAYATKEARPVIKLFHPIIGMIVPKDYDKLITEITAEQLSAVIASRKTRGEDKPLLLYIYSLDCAHCNINFDDINEIAESFDKEKLLVMAVATGATRERLSEYLNTIVSDICFKPLMLKRGEERQLGATNSFLDSGYEKPPYLGLINPSGRFIRMPVGLGRRKAILAKLYSHVK